MNSDRFQRTRIEKKDQSGRLGAQPSLNVTSCAFGVNYRALAICLSLLEQCEQRGELEEFQTLALWIFDNSELLGATWRHIFGRFFCVANKLFCGRCGGDFGYEAAITSVAERG